LKKPRFPKIHHSTPRACTPSASTIEPMTAASEQAGAVESSPIARPSMNPIAPFFRPLSVLPASGDAGFSINCRP
jgi:hypothetical protein